MRRRAVLALGAAVWLAAEERLPEFEVASVRKHKGAGPPLPPAVGDGPPPPPPPPVFRPSPNGLIIQNASLEYCLERAYSVREEQISGPSWIYDNRYDISARSGSPVETPELRKMLQALLTARFRLTLRRETRWLPVRGIVVARGGSKLTTSAPGTAEHTESAQLRDGSRRYVATNVGVDVLEQIVALPIGAPVIDLTGLTGRYDFTFLKPPFRGHPEDILASYKIALERQLGLTIDERKARLEMIVVERGNPTPVEN